MTEDAFVSALIELGLDSAQLQVAKKRVPTAHQLRMIFGEDKTVYSDEQAEADIAIQRKAIYDQYKQSGKDWDAYIASLDFPKE